MSVPVTALAWPQLSIQIVNAFSSYGGMCELTLGDQRLLPPPTGKLFLYEIPDRDFFYKVVQGIEHSPWSFSKSHHHQFHARRREKKKQQTNNQNKNPILRHQSSKRTEENYTVWL
ncbi:hypothetical protein PoB_007357200 [Plakobranchus ocellatus]|uniref:Uncharacterized protein n=1 Tax=Plakobranchus ocellatus TaxID=259542 RepID=A0AAV4DRX9_9GAST|nr:hypothetical protein PoB_007357200 [Plakobranchus ocellatus]